VATGLLMTSLVCVSPPPFHAGQQLLLDASPNAVRLRVLLA
jgi:hypothetical protein